MAWKKKHRANLHSYWSNIECTTIMERGLLLLDAKNPPSGLRKERGRVKLVVWNTFNHKTLRETLTLSGSLITSSVSVIVCVCVYCVKIKPEYHLRKIANMECAIFQFLSYNFFRTLRSALRFFFLAILFLFKLYICPVVSREITNNSRL